MSTDTAKLKTSTAANRLGKLYGIASTAVGILVIAYLVLINFPQALLAHSTNYGRFTVYSSQPVEPDIQKILDRAEEKLRRSPLYDDSFNRRIYLTGSFGMYALLSNRAYGSFANSVPFIDNVLVNRSDVQNDKVFAPRDTYDSRILSDVIAHEVTHLFIRQHFGTVRAITTIPTWKNEGYCEYVAGSSTIPFEDAVKLHRANSADDSAYRYTKYHAMVSYLLDHEHITVDELFTRDFDEKDIAAKAFANLEQSVS